MRWILIAPVVLIKLRLLSAAPVPHLAPRTDLGQQIPDRHTEQPLHALSWLPQPAASQRLPCVRNLGRKRSPTKSACEQTPLFTRSPCLFFSWGVSSPPCLLRSLLPFLLPTLSALSDKVQRLKSAARNSTCLCKWLSSLSLPRFQRLNTLKVKSHFPV